MPSFPTATEARRDLDPYLPLFRDVPLLAWERAMAEGPTWADTTTRKNLAWDAMCILVREMAKGYGLKLSQTKSRGRKVPLVLVPGSRYDYALRFNCLTDDHRAGGWHTGQRQMFEAQANGTQPQLPGFKPMIYLRGGYVLDALGIAVVRTPIVLSYLDTPLWAFDIAGGAQGGKVIALPSQAPRPAAPRIASARSKEEKGDTGTNNDKS